MRAPDLQRNALEREVPDPRDPNPKAPDANDPGLGDSARELLHPSLRNREGQHRPTSQSQLKMAEFDYELPTSAIAQVPIEPRDSARLLVDRGWGEAPGHSRISELPSLLRAGDLLVVNETRVMPARLPLRKRSGGAAEVLLLAPLEMAADSTSQRRALHRNWGNSNRGSRNRSNSNWGWAALVRPSRRIADGAVLVSDRDPSLRVVVGERLDGHRRAVQVLVGETPLIDVSQVGLLKQAGDTPLPPYIDPGIARRAIAQRLGVNAADGEVAQNEAAVDDAAVGDAALDEAAVGDAAVNDAVQTALADRYQTVYATSDGSAAAPTAGLHLTEQVLEGLRCAGVAIAAVDLTVGLDTFAPVTAEHADEHEMHSEHYRVPAQTLTACAAAERVVAVGTTTVRALESAARQLKRPSAAAGDAEFDADVCGWTDLYLRRGAEFLLVDAMLTNFHLPRSSLLLLIDAFVGPRWRDLYEVALADGYRFLSFGDAMLLSRSAPLQAQ